MRYRAQQRASGVRADRVAWPVLLAFECEHDRETTDPSDCQDIAPTVTGLRRQHDVFETELFDESGYELFELPRVKLSHEIWTSKDSIQQCQRSEIDNPERL